MATYKNTSPLELLYYFVCKGITIKCDDGVDRVVDDVHVSGVLGKITFKFTDGNSVATNIQSLVEIDMDTVNTLSSYNGDNSPIPVTLPKMKGKKRDQ
jgi:hypothetical protein